jgi:hypothetical protein
VDRRDQGALPQHGRRVADVQRRRLEHLEMQAAQQGNDVEPHILIEIEDLREALIGRHYEVEPISDEQRANATIRAVMMLSQQVSAVEVKIARLMWLLPALLFAYLLLAFILERL